jgi:hypothetical protein
VSETPGGRPRPTPRPRPGATPRPTPRPRVAGTRRERDEADAAAARPTPAPAPAPRPAPGTRATAAPTRGATTRPERSRSTTKAAKAAAAPATARRRTPALVLALAVLCVLAAAGVGYLGWQRLHPSYVNDSIFDAARSGVQALYAYDYKDSEGSVKGKLDVLTGDLRDQYKRDLSKGGIIDTYEQVSATTSYQVLDVGLQQVNQSQDTAKLVVFGQYVVKSVNTGSQPAPQGSECQVTPEGASSCTQTVEIGMVKVDGAWKINEAVVKTTS